MNRMKSIAVAGLFLAAAGCVSIPEGPSMMALPGTGRTFDAFRADDGSCRQYAYSQVGGTSAQRAAEDAGARTAVVGTLLGAAIGAAADGGSGAAIGAASGLALGSAVGMGTAESSGYGVQRRYDHAYIQCMYAKGHRVPVSGRFTSYTSGPAAVSPRPAMPPPPPSGGIAPAPSASVAPPPPAGTPPPPPPPGSAPAPRSGG